MTDNEDLISWLQRMAVDASGTDRERYLQAAELILALMKVVEIRNDIRLEEMEAQGRA